MGNFRFARRAFLPLAWLAAISLLLVGCRPPTEQFGVLYADRTVEAASSFPIAIEPDSVGLYAPGAKSGGGYFYDDVLEYRVWLHPENGAEDVAAGADYFAAFAQYERALEFAETAVGAEAPLVLVIQREWIDEPSQGQYVPMRSERVTEWRPEWLPGSKRDTASIEQFLARPPGQ